MHPVAKFVGFAALLLALAPAARAQAPRVVVVAIDAKTQAALGPFGGAYRARHAKLIEALNAGGVRGIGFDVYFPENPAQTAGTTALANAARASQAPVVLAVFSEIKDGEHVVEPNAAVIRDAGWESVVKASPEHGPKLREFFAKKN